MVLDAIGHVTEVGGNADSDTFRLQAEPHRIHRIVRDREAVHIDVPDGESGTWLKMFDGRHEIGPIERGAVRWDR